IYAFAGQLEDADTAPTVPEIATYAALHGQLEVQLAAWDKLKKMQLAAFQAHVKEAGITSP
ncbi:MAG: hypothetical protein KGL29_01325, partial [Alphaproteobacteria bacterium]|nr:hypothetical protein [Alphaproteobacteria bacterium]